ncbi:hypothetical protein J6590_027886 [Homalodisca vitripennis]|nr:hypothetical protein J6590_027886 [Homalodisca vitripennis]
MGLKSRWTPVQPAPNYVEKIGKYRMRCLDSLRVERSTNRLTVARSCFLLFTVGRCGSPLAQAGGVKCEVDRRTVGEGQRSDYRWFSGPRSVSHLDKRVMTVTDALEAENKPIANCGNSSAFQTRRRVVYFR